MVLLLNKYMIKENIRLEGLIGQEFCLDTISSFIKDTKICESVLNGLSVKVLELTAPSGNVIKGIVSLNGKIHKVELDKIKSTYITKSIISS